jgi:hypothetical protein
MTFLFFGSGHELSVEQLTYDSCELSALHRREFVPHGERADYRASML